METATTPLQIASLIARNVVPVAGALVPAKQPRRCCGSGQVGSRGAGISAARQITRLPHGNIGTCRSPLLSPFRARCLGRRCSCSSTRRRRRGCRSAQRSCNRSCRPPVQAVESPALEAGNLSLATEEWPLPTQTGKRAAEMPNRGGIPRRWMTLGLFALTADLRCADLAPVPAGLRHSSRGGGLSDHGTRSRIVGIEPVENNFGATP